MGQPFVPSSVPSQPLVVGSFGAPYGVRGWLTVHAATTERRNIIEYQPWFVRQQDDDWLPTVLQTWQQRRLLTVKLMGIDDRESAQALTRCQIAINTTQLPPLPSGEYYWHELLGCQVVTLEGYLLGQVSTLLETGSNDVLVVRADRQDACQRAERLIPLIEGSVIQKIDTQARSITVSWDPGF